MPENSSARVMAGLSKIDITPGEPIWLSGWCTRTSPSSGVEQRIYAKAMALRYPDGETAVILTADLLGYSNAMVQEVARLVQRRFNIERERLLLFASHNHSAPVTCGVLPTFYELTAEQAAVVRRYSTSLIDQLVEAIGTAIADLQPARLDFGQGVAGFGANRRRGRPGCRNLPGPVDHDVPALFVRDDGGKLRGVVFGYACHPTTIDNGMVNGDYPGHAQQEIESRHPEAIALFVAGCGGDINPIPRFRPGLAQMYGRILADAVDDAFQAELRPLVDGPACAYGEATLVYEDPPTLDELQRILPQRTGILRREVEALLAILDRDGRFPSSCTYPVQVWRFGDALTLIALSGETVVDYALRFKRAYDFEKTWVAAYANELMPYTPSKRVREEGYYEGADGMWQFSHPAPFRVDVEERIAKTAAELHDLVSKTAVQRAATSRTA